MKNHTHSEDIGVFCKKAIIKTLAHPEAIALAIDGESGAKNHRRQCQIQQRGFPGNRLLDGQVIAMKRRSVPRLAKLQIGPANDGIKKVLRRIHQTRSFVRKGPIKPTLDAGKILQQAIEILFEFRSG